MTQGTQTCVDWDEVEAAGHDFTLIAPIERGHSRYICEHCATFLLVGPGDMIEVWHRPNREDRTCEPRRTKGQPLREKLRALQERELDRLGDI